MKAEFAELEAEQLNILILGETGTLSFYHSLPHSTLHSDLKMMFMMSRDFISIFGLKLKVS